MSLKFSEKENGKIAWCELPNFQSRCSYGIDSNMERAGIKERLKRKLSLFTIFEL